METMTYTGSLVVLTCWCGMAHAVPSGLRKHQLNEHDRGRNFDIYCPLGHAYIPSGPSRVERERARAERAENETARVRAQLDQTTASLRATKGQLTKTKNRIAKGVCPCCHRSFVNVARHMTGQHPDYAA